MRLFSAGAYPYISGYLKQTVITPAVRSTERIIP
jgi:hypothetical protein